MILLGFKIPQNEKIIYQLPQMVEDRICSFIEKDIERGHNANYFCEWSTKGDVIQILISGYANEPNEVFNKLIGSSNRYIELSSCNKVIPMLFYSDIYYSKNLIVEYHSGTENYIKQREFPMYHGLVLKFIYDDKKNYPEGVIIE